MRRYFFVCSCVLSAFWPKAQVNNFTINGHITGRDTGFIYISYPGENYARVKDTARVMNGNFTFKGFIAEPGPVSLAGNNKPRTNDNGDFTVFCLEPGVIDMGLTENHFAEAVITGSKTQAEWQDVMEGRKAIARSFDSLMAGPISVSAQDSLKNAYRNAAAQLEFAFIKAHPASFLSPYFLRPYLQDLPLDSARMLFNSFTLKVKNSNIGKIIYTQLNGKAATALNGEAPRFTRVDVLGNTITLERFKGTQYTLLNFWASWCAPCRKGHTVLDTLYKKYHAKGLDIIAISLDDDKTAWQTAIQKDHTMAWHHILSASTKSGTETPVNIITQYNVTPVPVTILLDKNLHIVARYDGLENEDGLKQKLEAVFGSKN